MQGGDLVVSGAPGPSFLQHAAVGIPEGPAALLLPAAVFLREVKSVKMFLHGHSLARVGRL